MDANTAAYWAGQIAGPVGGTIVLIYVLRKLISFIDRLLDLVAQLATKREARMEQEPPEVP